MPLFAPFLLTASVRDEPIPARPVVVMQVAEFVTDPKAPHPIISPHLMTATEVDEQVDRVIAEAEAFRRLAKHQLELAQSRDRHG